MSHSINIPVRKAVPLFNGLQIIILQDEYYNDFGSEIDPASLSLILTCRNLDEIEQLYNDERISLGERDNAFWAAAQ